MKNSKGGLVAVVGPSGVGKDSVITGVLAALPELNLVKRTITRPQEFGGEDYHSVNEAEFNTAVAGGKFCLHWKAHGLRYGIPRAVLTEVEKGNQYIANLSRSVLTEAAAMFPDFLVIHVTAPPETLARRLAMRGRENEEEILARLARRTYPLPSGLNVHRVCNNRELPDAVDRAVLLIDGLTHTIEKSNDESRR